ncbi:hypothetical protein Tco_0409702 [Tanacetum coccineum]
MVVINGDPWKENLALGECSLWTRLPVTCGTDHPLVSGLRLFKTRFRGMNGSYKDLEILFQPMFDEYFDSISCSDQSLGTVVNAPMVSIILHLFLQRLLKMHLLKSFTVISQGNLRLSQGEPSSAQLHQGICGSCGMSGFEKKDVGKLLSFLEIDWLGSGHQKKQGCTAIQQTEAEYIAILDAVPPILWMKSQLKDYGFYLSKSTIRHHFIQGGGCNGNRVVELTSVENKLFNWHVLVPRNLCQKEGLSKVTIHISTEVLGMIKRSKCENLRIVTTEMELCQIIRCTKGIHYEDGNPARAYIKQALGSYERSHKGVKASANSDIIFFFTSAQDGNKLLDDERLSLADDLKKAHD